MLSLYNGGKLNLYGMIEMHNITPFIIQIVHTEPAAQLRRQEADQALQGPRAAKRTDNRGKGIDY